MINFDYITKENIKEHNKNYPNIPHHVYKVLEIEVCGSGKKVGRSILIKFICMLRIQMKKNFY